MVSLHKNAVVKWQPPGGVNRNEVYHVVSIHGDIVLLKQGRNVDSPKKAYYRAHVKDVRGLFVDIKA